MSGPRALRTRLLLRSVRLAGLGIFAAAAAFAQEAPVLRAHPVETAVSVDGVLDEAVWQQAEAITDFRQHDPVEGAAPTFPTEVRILYGPDHLYVGAVLHDAEPGGIRATLGRRDEVNQADWLIVSLDSYFDQKTAYTFAVNAAGVQYDGLRSEGGGDGPSPGGLRGVDASWDAIWTSGVQVHSAGWSVEMRIPYSMLRFAEAEVQTWGVHVSRQIPRLGEVVEWPLVLRTQRGNFVARYARLEGLRGVDVRRDVQATPYVLSRMDTREDQRAPGSPVYDGSVDVGGDLKMSLGAGHTLNATVNPDFGQVESDPAVLNLTAFETFYTERRPFFVEGTQIYQFSVGPGRLLYTRRIGAVEPIVGAAKLSGRTAGGLSYGVLGATTGDRFDPSRHYGVVRLSQQIGAYSSAGGIVTGLHAPRPGGSLRSLATGLDWDLRMRENRYGVEGFAALTHRNLAVPDLGDETGAAGKVWLRKRQGVWSGFVGFDVFSDGFNPNDVGQLRENNFTAALLSVDHELNAGQPFGPFLRVGLGSFSIQRFAYDDGRDLGLQVSLGGRGTLRGFQTVDFELDASRVFGGYDLYETRGLGPWARPREVIIGGEFETDERRDWQLEPGVWFGWQGAGRRYGTALEAIWNVGSRLSIGAEAETEWERGMVAWSSNETFAQAGDAWAVGARSVGPDALDAADYVAFDDGGALGGLLAGVAPLRPGFYFVPVFGARDTRSVDFTLRSTVTFRPNLSLQFYGQLFLARGRYGDFRILRNEDDLAAFAAFPKRDDFAFSSLQSNAVLRWEYRPGSTLFLVWTQGRHADDVLNPLSPQEASPYERPLREHLGDTFGLFPENVFLVKLNYTFLR